MNKRKLTEEDLEYANKCTQDLDKFIKKINALMVSSCEGDAPQMLKICLFIHLADISKEELSNYIGKQKYNETMKIAKGFLEEKGIKVNKVHKKGSFTEEELDKLYLGERLKGENK